jgi:hypothetical protein
MTIVYIASLGMSVALSGLSNHVDHEVVCHTIRRRHARFSRTQPGPRMNHIHQEMLKILFFNFFAKKLKKKGHPLVKLLFLLNSKYIISKLMSTSRKSRKSRV